MDLAGTAISREFAFNILLQNCVERQAVYGVTTPHPWSASQPKPAREDGESLMKEILTLSVS
jgi:hypothetical protein